MTDLGELLDGRFRVREVLTGGMGQVLICDLTGEGGPAHDPGAQVALKTFQRRYFFDPAARDSFLREASIWLRLSDLPYVMPVMGIRTIGDQPYIVMPAVEPGPAGERSVADLLRDGPLEPELALRHAFQVTLALREADGRFPGLVHGDIKPANVLLIAGAALLSDFGLVSAAALGGQESRLEGTWRYRAPELWADGSAPTSVAGDVYALGALLFEMLTGQAPLSARDHRRADWATAHREITPRAPAGFPAAGLPAAAMALALSCLAKEPAERPGNMAEVAERMALIYAQFDQAHLIEVMSVAQLISTKLPERFDRLRHDRIRGLLELDQAQQALDELDAVPAEEYDARLWLIRGQALVSLERPGEALIELNHALDGDLSAKERDEAFMESALAMKRLGRFAEARDVLLNLVPRVGEDQLPGVLVNLGTVHVEAGEGEEAVRVLEPLVRRSPRIPSAWANLGQAYTLVGRFEDAAAAYGRALSLAPQLGQVRLWLAGVYMDHLGRIEEAWEALDLAFDSGHRSQEWFVRMVAASLLLDRADTAQALLESARDSLPELATELMAKSIDMASELADRYRDGGREPEQAPPADSAPDQPSAAHPGPDEPSAADAEPAPAGAKPKAPAATATAPFLNVRYYLYSSPAEFTIDYYQEPEAPDYLTDLFMQVRRATRDPRFAMGGGGLRGSPFVFTVCPGCSMSVLTNRNAGKSIKCRMCGTRFPTTPVHGPAFDRILAEVSAGLGIEGPADSQVPDVHLLLIQPPDSTFSTVTGEICRDAGLSELGQDHLMTARLRMEAVSRRIFSRGRPYSVWKLARPGTGQWARGATPQALAPVITELQSRVPGVVTFSTTVSGDDWQALDMSVAEVQAEAERELRDALRSGEAQAPEFRRLASILIYRGKHREAERRARAAVAADDGSAEGWRLLGEALLGLDDFVGARDALDAALARDPTSVPTMATLAVCYEQMGDTVRAAEFSARAASRTAGELP
jgi:serine/threonine protein kinase/Tfp pilus assembly protein PilF